MGFVQELLALQIQPHATLLRTGLGLTRELRPVLRIGDLLLVTSAATVREVLGREQEFLSGVLYAPKMKLGPFVLGMDKTDQYLAERAALVRSLRDKADQFSQLVTQEARVATIQLMPS